MTKYNSDVIVFYNIFLGAKPFKCPHCEQRFRTSGHRKNHITSHFRSITPKRRRTGLRSGDTSLIGDVQQQMTQDQLLPNQVISIDQNTLVPGANVLPLSLSVDAAGNVTDSGLAAQILQGLDGGVQLQLGQGIQITGIDPNMVNQTFQIDASLLQQLQGSVNLTVNPNIVQAADPNLVQNIQIQQVAPTDAVNPNIIIQQGALEQTNAAQNASGTDVQQVPGQTGLDVPSVVPSSNERQLVTLQQQQGGLQQVALQVPQLVQTADGLTMQPPENVENIQGDSIPSDIVAPASPGENSGDETEDKVNIREQVADNIAEHLVTDEGNIVLPSTTDTSVLDEQQEPAVTGQDQNLIEAHTVVNVTPGDTDRNHVCHVSKQFVFHFIFKKLTSKNI